MRFTGSRPIVKFLRIYADIFRFHFKKSSERCLYLNWYYQPQESITRVENITQSCQAAKRYIQEMAEARSRHYVVVLDDALDPGVAVVWQEK